MNKCDKKQLTLWVAGVLDPEEARACEHHLAQCAKCQKDHVALKAITNDFGLHAASLPSVEGVNGLHRSLERRLREETEASNNVFWFRKWLVPISISTAALIASLLVWFSGQKKTPVSVPPQLVQSKPRTPKNLDSTPAPTLSSYSSATRKSLDEFDRALDAQVRSFSTHPARGGDLPISLNTLL